MNLEAEKLDLLQTIINSGDAGLINDLKIIISTRKSDWFDELSTEQQKDVLLGIKDADNGDVITHEEAVKHFGKWGLK